MSSRLPLVSLFFLGIVVKAAHAAPSIDARGKELVQRWVTAQNQGDFAAYSALYAPSFQGVLRARSGPVTLDRERWLRDRARAFKAPMKVTIDSVVVTSRRAGSGTTRGGSWVC